MLPSSTHNSVFVNGGDGCRILDHEICILNGDLNYRIDAMTRDAVIRAVRENNLNKLLERDQLMLSRKRNPGFRLRAFAEKPITFAPTYKYDVGTDNYDTSEKRRSPAWCDRILYKSLGKVKCEEYRRWDQLRVSDHRPVSARFRMRVKTVDERKKELTRARFAKDYQGHAKAVTKIVKRNYLVDVLGLTPSEAAAVVA